MTAPLPLSIYQGIDRDRGERKYPAAEPELAGGGGEFRPPHVIQNPRVMHELSRPSRPVILFRIQTRKTYSLLCAHIPTSADTKPSLYARYHITVNTLHLWYHIAALLSCSPGEVAIPQRESTQTQEPANDFW